MSNSDLCRKKIKPIELFLAAAIYGAAYFAVFLLLGMAAYVFFRGFRALSIGFFTSVTSFYKGTIGIAGNLVNTLYIIIITLLIAVPIGAGAAVYLSEYAVPGRLVDIVEFSIEVLAGIPSIIFGLFGMVFFGNVLGLGYSLLNGALTLAFMVTPLIVQNSLEALRTVPEGYRSAALGLGAGKWYMIRTILLPAAMPGILSGIILAVGRIVGESAALLFTAGGARNLPKLDIAGLWNKIFESGGTLAVELYLQMQNGDYGLAFGIGCVLMIIVLLLNFMMNWAAEKL